MPEISSSGSRPARIAAVVVINLAIEAGSRGSSTLSPRARRRLLRFRLLTATSTAPDGSSRTVIAPSSRPSAFATASLQARSIVNRSALAPAVDAAIAPGPAAARPGG